MTIEEAAAHYAHVRFELPLDENEYAILKQLRKLIYAYRKRQVNPESSPALMHALHSLEDMGFRFEHWDNQPAKQMLFEGDAAVLLTVPVFRVSENNAEFHQDYEFVHSSEIQRFIAELKETLFRKHGGNHEWW
ncbi:hypothetical protein Q5H92_21815 [Hymenobacter sp. M29]|uniref:Uncharacterized protein n=1 Tax=Hymenobacter mellowenesis TaxID=3063995 RepID=A0ABT9AI19_9BACT|nr:hypothetical protein [Hymenobacter sp. M29]MDO7849017.1 hypothetical protein [Hymenobacter sp. M29]